MKLPKKHSIHTASATTVAIAIHGTTTASEGPLSERVSVLILMYPIIWFGTETSGVTISSFRVGPAQNGYLKITGEGKQEGSAKA